MYLDADSRRPKRIERSMPWIANDDGVLELGRVAARAREEGVGQLLRPETDDALQDAVVVCGYEAGPAGSVRRDQWPRAGRRRRFDPARVADGVVDDAANVVYGDGASATVLKAAGVTEPRAIVVAWPAPTGARRPSRGCGSRSRTRPSQGRAAGRWLRKGESSRRAARPSSTQGDEMGLGLAEQVVEKAWIGPRRRAPCTRPTRGGRAPCRARAGPSG